MAKSCNNAYIYEWIIPFLSVMLEIDSLLVDVLISSANSL